MKKPNVKRLLSDYQNLREKAFFPETQNQAKEEIFAQLDYFSSLGLNTYLIGLVDNFDISFANILIEYREHHPEIQYIVAMHDKSQAYFSPILQQEFNRIVSSSDLRVISSHSRHLAVFMFPNEYLTGELKIDVIYFHPFGDGGVLYAYNRGEECHNTVNIIDLFSTDNKIPL